MPGNTQQTARTGGPRWLNHPGAAARAGVARLRRWHKGAILIAVDTGLALCAVLLAVVATMPTAGALPWAWILPAQALCVAPLSLALGIARIRLKSLDFDALGRVALFGLCVAVCTAGILLPAGAPLIAIAVFAAMFILLSAAARIVMLRLLLWLYRGGRTQLGVLIYGAGTTGMQLAAALAKDPDVCPVAFVDDNPALENTRVAGLPVIRPAGLSGLVARRRIDRVLLAIPSLSPPRRAALTRRLRALGVEVQALPSFAQLIGAPQGRVPKGIVPGDLTGRSHLDGAPAAVAPAYSGRTVLVTGAGGSVGSELCRQLLEARPARLVLVERNEYALFTAEMEFRALAEEAGTAIVPVLGSVGDARLMRAVMTRHKPDVVLHAAAYKHVPLVEANPLAGLENNVLGTQTVAEAARDAGVGRFILISSDKAVRPTNVMGASKRLAEMLVQDLAVRAPGTGFAIVRFGNVIGSSGSVVPLFRDQIARGGPVTLTHPEVTRYFMTIQEAVGLVLLAGSFSAGEEAGADVYVLDMGQPVRIRDLAQRMIEAAGYRPREAGTADGDIEIVTTGLRPGEKLHEELLIGAGLVTTPHPKIMRAREVGLSEIEIAHALRALGRAIAEGDTAAALAVTSRWVEGFVTATEPQPEPPEKRSHCSC